MDDQPGTDGPRRLWIHVGCSKTGTSALQQGLWESADALAAVGVGLPYVGRGAHLSGLIKPLGWSPVAGFAGEHRPRALAKVAETWRSTPGRALLMSNEELAECGPREIEVIADSAEQAGLEVNVVLSVRDWAQQLPSDYQQFLKHRLPDPYLQFLDDVRERRGFWAEHFWRRQDPIDILDRWSAAADPSRLHLMIVPSYSVDPEGVFDLMGGIAGFPSRVVSRPAGSVNPSFGVIESEVYRRVNAALGDRLPHYQREYAEAVRWPFVRGVLARDNSAKLTLPPEHLGWVQDQARRTVGQVRERGYPVHGDLDSLVPAEEKARPLPSYDEREVADAAIAALARYAERALRERERLRAELTGE